MLTWLRRRCEEARRAEADASALIAADHFGAYSEARQRQQDAHNPESFAHWGRVARAVSRRTGKRLGLDTATRMASDANYGSYLGTFASPPHAPVPELDPLDELVRLTSEGPQSGKTNLLANQA